MSFSQSAAFDQLSEALGTLREKLGSDLHEELAEKLEAAHEDMIAAYDKGLANDEDADGDHHQYYRDGADDMLNAILALLD